MEKNELNLDNKKILIVDDNQALRRTTRKILETAGFEVLEAEDGASAIHMMSEKPDLVLQDLILPDIAGYDLVYKLRAASENKLLPVLAFTGYLEKPLEPWDTSGGFNALLVKPVPASVLLDAIMTNLAV